MYLNGLEHCSFVDSNGGYSRWRDSLDLSPWRYEAPVLWQILPFGFSRYVDWEPLWVRSLSCLLLSGKAVCRCSNCLPLCLVALCFSYQPRLQLEILLNRSGSKECSLRMHQEKVRCYSYLPGKWNNYLHRGAALGRRPGRHLGNELKEEGTGVWGCSMRWRQDSEWEHWHPTTWVFMRLIPSLQGILCKDSVYHGSWLDDVWGGLVLQDKVSPSGEQA